jgi:hypothetical protein
MKLSKSDVRRNTFALPRLRFEDQQLTSFSGLVVFQSLFAQLGLKERLRRCFRHRDTGNTYAPGQTTLLLIIHLLLGFRGLRESGFYADDPMVQRLVGWRQIPDVSTLSRFLSRCGDRCVAGLRQLNRELILDRLTALNLRRVTLDFDGSVIGTGRAAEGTAIGFNRKKKGQRSYYPLLCTVAQTGQVLDVLHRPGNVHDSRGAKDFMRRCILRIRKALPKAILEVRIDGAFFSEEIVDLLVELDVEFTISVPFRRFAQLKTMTEERRRWRHGASGLRYFECRWKPKSWQRKLRFLFIRTETKRRTKQPIQLDLFVPFEYGYEFKVVVTNKRLSAKKAVAFHNGRGAQEAVFAELKSQTNLDYVPVRSLRGNQTYLLAAVLAHNLNRELQVATRPPDRRTTEKRSPMWCFDQLTTIRRKFLLRAGRLTRPQGGLTLTLSPNRSAKYEMLHYLDALAA